MTTKKSTPAPRAAYAGKPVTPLINAYCDWLEREVGIKLDADARRAVYLGSALRTEFQKSNRESRDAVLSSIKLPAKARASKPAPKAKAAPAPSRRRPAKGSTVATPEGVVIAEQRHVDLTEGDK
jgi:hypothetical protein